MLFIYTIASVLLISLISFVGVFTLPIKPENLKKITMLLVSLSAGTLLGDSFLHVLPEAIEKNSGIGLWLWLLFGILLFFVLEKIICWRHCHIPTSQNHPHPVGLMNLIGDAFHNLLDGILIAGSFMAGLPLGIATTIAVIAHEIPQEIGDFGVLIHAGYTRKRALFLNFLTALTAIIGAAATWLIGSSVENISTIILPLTAGGFIYIATADLIPELKKDLGWQKSLTQLFGILAGIILMLGLKIIFE